MKEMTEGERSMMRFRFCALGIYLLICFYDFLFTPIWWGLNRPDISEFMKIMATVEDPLIRQQLMIKLTGQHSPFTLRRRIISLDVPVYFNSECMGKE